MKKLLILFLFVFLFKTGNAQVTYFNYFDHTSQWSEFKACYNLVYWRYYIDRFYFNGDTLINSKWYYKLNLDRKDSVSASNIQYLQTYYGALREDSLKRVYIFYPYDTVEELMYDYDLSVGDTVHCVLSSIDTIYLGSNPRKVFYFGNQSMVNTLYEGIGPACGMFAQLCLSPSECSFELVCYSQQGNSIQFSTTHPCRFSIITRNENTILPDADKLITIFPNPASTDFFIEFTNFKEYTKIYLYNSLGCFIKELLFCPDQSSNILHVTNIASGMYFVKINLSDKTLTKKIVIN